MKAQFCVITSVSMACLLAGCDTGELGTTLSLGKVSYDDAFGAARDVMSQYFSIASADKDAGLIESRPKPVEAKPEGIFRHSAARQIARLSLRQDGQEVLGNLSVEVQRQGSAVHHQLQMASSGYDTVPNRTPAEIDAATTAEQNEAWETESSDRTLEYQILRQIYETLHGAK